MQLSSFNPKNKVHALDFAHDIELKLSVNETATCVGEYEVAVLAGIITVYGAVLRPESGRKRLYAASTQALPQIQARQDGTMIRLFNVKPLFQKLERLSPHFRNISSGNNQSFTLLGSSDEDALQRSLSPLEVDRDMDAALRTLSAKVMVEPRKPRIMAVGAKSSGKSTFNRILCNHIQSWNPAGRCQYLDLDPGQPEFGPSGQVSLVEVAMPLLGPSWTHFAEQLPGSIRMLRSHTIASTSFKHDPDHYKDCVADLIKYANTDLPLIVNACGWVNGLGASVLTEVASLLQVTDLVFLEPLDAEIVEPLQSSAIGAAVFRIPRQSPKPSSRTPAEHRAMQTMAYFHHRSRSSGVSRFIGKPVSRWRPYNVSYAGEDQSISAIASYGQASKPEFLSEVLDGSIVAINVLDFGHAAKLGDMIGRTPEGLPFLLPNANGTQCTLDPKHSSCLGLALVRGIDAENQQIQLVMPLPKDEVASLAEKDVILVRGSFDAPEWAYLEDLYHNDAAGNEMEADKDHRPWVSKKKEMVGIEGAVWRLRHPPLPGSSTPRR